MIRFICELLHRMLEVMMLGSDLRFEFTGQYNLWEKITLGKWKIMIFFEILRETFAKKIHSTQAWKNT